MQAKFRTAFINEHTNYCIVLFRERVAVIVIVPGQNPGCWSLNESCVVPDQSDLT